MVDITDPSKFLMTCLMLGQLDRERRKRGIQDENFNRVVKPDIHKLRELDALKMKKAIIEETVRVMKENGGRLPFEWTQYIEGLAKTFNTTERRIRRIFRKGGLMKEGDK